jgi:hypothetical protein
MGSYSPNLFCGIVGDTAKARKGTTWEPIRDVMHAADRHWTEGPQEPVQLPWWRRMFGGYRKVRKVRGTIAASVVGGLVGGGLGLLIGLVSGAGNPFFYMAIGISVGAGVGAEAYLTIRGARPGRFQLPGLRHGRGWK